MKKLITILCLVFGLGVILSPITNAEEAVDEPTQETTEFEEIVYTTDPTDGDVMTLTLVSPTEAKIHLSIPTEGVDFTMDTTYVIEDGIIKIAMGYDEEYCLFINEEGYLEKYQEQPTIEEDVVEPEDEFITTDLGEFFEEEVAPYLIDAGISLIGFIVSVLILWLKNKGSISNLNEKISTAVETNQNDISRNLALTNEINTKTQEDIRVLREEILVENKELKEEINRLNIERNRLYEDNQRIQNINNDIISLKKSLKILAVNDPKLVANGQAKLLAKELETNGEEQGI